MNDPYTLIINGKLVGYFQFVGQAIERVDKIGVNGDLVQIYDEDDNQKCISKFIVSKGELHDTKPISAKPGDVRGDNVSQSNPDGSEEDAN